MQVFEVFLWSKWTEFGETTLLPTYDCVQAPSAFVAVEKAMRARRLLIVGHAVAEVVSSGGFLLFYRAYGVRLSRTKR